MSQRKQNAQSNVAKRRTQSNERPTILLKTLHDDIMRDNKNATITTKQMRAKLRATPTTRDIHTHNASWIFTQSQYDIVRSMFDASYAQRIARRAKRDTSSRQRVKAQTQSNDVANVVDETNA